MRAFLRKSLLHLAALFTRRYDRRIHPAPDNVNAQQKPLVGFTVEQMHDAQVLRFAGVGDGLIQTYGPTLTRLLADILRRLDELEHPDLNSPGHRH